MRKSSYLADTAVLLGTFLLIYGLARVGAGFFVAFHPPGQTPNISLNPSNLPYYAARSVVRMFAGLFLSVLFTLIYGYAAAKNHKAERVLVPLLDILQSVPVLGFLSITVTGFIALFPGSLFGLECASIFAIFTAQAWNMTFSFYHSLITLPKELDEAARLFRLSKWRRFFTVEVPSSMIGLVWNGMMSFGGGWFFLAASEAISVLKTSYTLPGIGSYVGAAVEARDVRALIWAVITMVVVIVAIDQLFWKPVVAWSQKFRLDRTASGIQAESWVLDLIRASHLPRMLGHRIRQWKIKHYRPPAPPKTEHETWLARRRRKRKWRINDDMVFGLVVGAVCVASFFYGARFVTQEVAVREVGTAFGLGLLTLLRVTVLIAVSTLVWTPIGVAIGFNPRLARTLQPLALLAASFPANFLFPLATIVFIKIGLSLDWGSMLLMALGAQWYVLFNAIAGAIAVPSDLREMCASMGLRGWPLWKKLIIPAIFPAWVTGAVTASGGAWNASIVSEVVSWGNHTLTAHGIGTYIASATKEGDWPRIVLGVSTMCILVVTVNRLLWRRLYQMAEVRYRLG